VTNSSNNYGPYQFPEKLIPLTIRRGHAAQSLPVYGRGENVRDWLFVDDHAAALVRAMEQGTPGETYVFGGRAEYRNIDVVRALCALLDEYAPLAGGKGHETLIEFVDDRPGHDYRYAVNPAKAERELGWRATTSFEAGLRATVQWYLANHGWCEQVVAGTRDGVPYHSERLGLGLAI
jgi:dTDP-glucose 4,6-dehydratase